MTVAWTVMDSKETDMTRTTLFTKSSIVAFVVSCASVLLTGGVLALTPQCTWCDTISDALIFYQDNYPTSNFEPYQDTLIVVRRAMGSDDQQTVTSEMSKFFQMLRNRSYGINGAAADELHNFALMVTPIQEYGISAPPPVTGQ